MRIRFIVLAACLSMFACTPAVSSDWKISWGDLHSHTALSDGTGTPDQAYEYASNKCDFLALTEHNHMVDPSEIESLRNSSESVSSEFVAIIGQEFSTIKGGNHLNVYNLKENIPGAMNSDYKTLYSVWLPDYQTRHPNDIVLGQFNHPNNRHKDYGIASVSGISNYDNDWDAFSVDANRWVKLISIVNGPGSHTKGQHNIHADIKNGEVNTWFFYLDKGMRLSPTANHDTHVESWGDLTNARTGVWVNGEKGRDQLLRALKNGTCFATEDKNLSVWYEINGKPMGSQLADMGDAELELKVTVADGDEPASNYKVEVYRELVGDGELAEKIVEGRTQDNGTYVEKVAHRNGDHEAYIVHVMQVDESDDVDDAWTAPIYIGPGSSEPDDYSTDSSVTDSGSAGTDTAMYVGSKKSEVYHYPNCKSVLTIKADNLVSYNVLPEGRRLHKNCPVE